jgi:hypothetical protein
MMRRIHLAACCIVLMLSACTYYVAPGASAPGYPGTSYDRSFGAAAGAMRDEGLSITLEDRNAGTVVGTGGGGTVTASVRTQADGSVRVQFDSRDARDPALIERISRGYDRRMGR